MHFVFLGDLFVFDPLAIAMVVAANMAFAQVKGVARDPKDYEVYKKKEHIIEKKEEPKPPQPPKKTIKPKPYRSPWGSPGGKLS